MNSYANSYVMTESERERLILEHMPQVRLIARRFQERLPENVALDDLISTGVIGLISAIDHFDPGQKRQAEDIRRVQDPRRDSRQSARPGLGPRQKRRQAKQIDAAIARMEQRPASRAYGRRDRTRARHSPSTNITSGCGDSWAEYRQPRVRRHEQGQDLLQYIPDTSEALPSELLERSELERLVAEGIGGIPQIEQTVLSLYYHEELTLREIAQVVNLHESRISQLKSQAILRLRGRLSEQWPRTRGLVTA